MTLKTTPFDPAEFLEEPDAQLEYLRESFASEDVAEILRAMSAVARARGITQIAKEPGSTGESLAEVLSPGGNPEISTIIRILHAFQIKLTVERLQ